MLLLHAIAVLATLAYAHAQTTTSSPKAGKEAQLFIHNIDPNAQWAASIQNACQGSTTYVISCRSAPTNNACSPQTATITEGSDFYIVTTPAIYSETSATYTESCSLDTAKSSALCTATILAGLFGHDIATTISYNLTGTNYYQYDVQITAGANHAANGGACLSKVKGDAQSARLGGGLQGVVIVGSAIVAGVSIIMAL